MLVERAQMIAPVGGAGVFEVLLVVEPRQLDVGYDAVQHRDLSPDGAWEEDGVFVAQRGRDGAVLGERLEVARRRQANLYTVFAAERRSAQSSVENRVAAARKRSDARVLAAPAVGGRVGQQDGRLAYLERHAVATRRVADGRHVVVEAEVALVASAAERVGFGVARRDRAEQQVDPLAVVPRAGIENGTARPRQVGARREERRRVFYKQIHREPVGG